MAALEHGKRILAGMAAALICWGAHAEDCIRSTPSPIFATDRAGLGSHAFALKSDHEATERFRLPSGMQVEVELGGCEYFVTTFRFQSKAHSAVDGYKEAASLLGMLQGEHADTTFDLNLAAATLLKEAGRKPRLGRELAVHGDGVPPLEAIVTVGRRKASGPLEVTLFRGPL